MSSLTAAAVPTFCPAPVANGHLKLGWAASINAIPGQRECCLTTFEELCRGHSLGGLLMLDLSYILRECAAHLVIIIF